MTPQEKQETFKNELALIQDESIRTGIKKLITHSSQEYVNDIEIMVIKKYIG